MRGDDTAERAGPRAHHDRLRLDAVADDADSAQERAARHTGRGDERVVSLDEVVGGQDAVDVESRVEQTWRSSASAATAFPASRRRGT